MAQGPSVYGIDVAPLNIQGVNPNVMGQPLQYNPLNFQVPLQLARMRQQERMNESTIAIREKELAMREKLLEYEMAAEERKLWKEGLDMLHGAYMGGGGKGSGGSSVSFGGNAPGLSGDLGVFSDSPVYQKILEQQNQAYQEGIQSLQEWQMDNTVTSSDNQNYTKLLSGIASNSAQIYSNPDYHRLNYANELYKKWADDYYRGGNASDVQNATGFAEIMSKIADINSKDSFSAEDADEFRQLLIANTPKLDKSRFDDYTKQWVDRGKQVYEQTYLEYSDIDGMLEQGVIKYQTGVADLTKKAVDGAINDPYMRKLMLNDGLITQNEIDTYDQLRKAAATNDPQAKQALEDFMADDLSFMQLKNHFSSRIDAENVYGTEDSPYKAATGYENIPTPSSGRRGSSRSTTDPLSMNANQFRLLYPDNQAEAVKALRAFGGDMDSAMAYMDQYQNKKAAIDSCVKQKMENEGKTLTEAKQECIDSGLEEPMPLNTFIFRSEMGNMTNSMDEAFSTTTSEDIEGVLDSALNEADGNTALNDDGLTKKGVLFEINNYNDNYWVDEDTRVFLDTPMNAYQYLSEFGYVYGSPYIAADGTKKKRTVFIDDQDLKIMNTESGLIPYKVTVDNNGKLSVGGYQFNGKSGAMMISQLADMLPDEAQGLKDKVAAIIDGNTNDYKKGVGAQDVENVLAELVGFDPGLAIAHQKAYWEDNFLKPKKTRFDRSVSMGGAIKVTLPNGEEVPVSSNIRGFDYMMKATATNHGDYDAFMNKYTQVITRFRQAEGRPPNPEEAIRLMGMARKQYAGNYIYATEAGRYYTTTDNLAAQGITEDQFNQLMDRTGLSKAEISLAITSIAQKGGPGDTKNERILTRDPIGRKLWVGAQVKARGLTKSWAQRVNAETNDALAMFNGNFQNEFTLPPEMTADKKVNDPTQAPGTQQGGGGTAQSTTPPGSDKINKLNEILGPGTTPTVPKTQDQIDISPNSPKSIERWDAEMEENNAKIADLQSQIEELKGQPGGLSFEKKARQEKIEDLQGQISGLEDEAKRLYGQKEQAMKYQKTVLEVMDKSLAIIENLKPSDPVILPITAVNNQAVEVEKDGDRYSITVGSGEPKVYTDYDKFISRLETIYKTKAESTERILLK